MNTKLQLFLFYYKCVLMRSCSGMLPSVCIYSLSFSFARRPYNSGPRQVERWTIGGSSVTQRKSVESKNLNKDWKKSSNSVLSVFKMWLNISFEYEVNSCTEKWSSVLQATSPETVLLWFTAVSDTVCLSQGAFLSSRQSPVSKAICFSCCLGKLSDRAPGLDLYKTIMLDQCV